VTKRGKKGIVRSDETWIVLEKIHGCNFSFVTNGEELGCARRTELLGETESFYSWQKIRDKHKANILKLFVDVQNFADTETSKVGLVVLFGELFGGIYPHPDVEDLGVLHCQKGVYYSPDINFLAFDILYMTKESDEKHFVPYSKVMEILKKREILCIPPLFEGSMADCFQFDIKRDSMIPPILGYPKLKNNQIEGVVIKQLDGKALDRKIFKHKNAKFEEVNPKVAATKYELNRDAKGRAVNNFYEEISRYINENRLNSVRSKIGEFDFSRINEVGKLLALDAVEDFRKDQKEIWKDLGSDEVRDKCMITTESMCRAFIQTWLTENKKGGS